jgi:hypothetical protein
VLLRPHTHVCPSIRTDLRNAGAEVVDEEVVIDGNLISSRSPDDLPAFCPAIVNQFARRRHALRDFKSQALRRAVRRVSTHSLAETSLVAEAFGTSSLQR